MKRILFYIVMVFMVTACGKKGPLVPPEALVPAAVSDLKVAQKGEFFRLSWSQPSREAGGRPLSGLAGFDLFRRVVLPPAEDCEQCPGAYQLLRKVDMDYLQGVDYSGSRLSLNDNTVQTGTTYQYKIFSRKSDGTPSAESNRVRRQKVIPPPPPVVKAVSSPAAITVELVPGPADPATAAARYNIYRWRTGQPVSMDPLNDTPVTGTTFEDVRVQRGVTYHYVVRAVAGVAGEEVESNPSNEVTGALTEPD